jgi:hypothetical protein
MHQNQATSDKAQEAIYAAAEIMAKKNEITCNCRVSNFFSMLLYFIRNMKRDFENHNIR